MNTLDPGPATDAARSLCDRLLAAARPLRVLDAVRWPAEIELAFFDAGAKRLPPVTADTYRQRPLGFDPSARRDELRGVAADARRSLGDSAAGRQIARAAREFERVTELLSVRGTPRFAALSRELYGTTTGPGVADELFAALGPLLDVGDDGGPSVLVDCARAAAVLGERLGRYFRDPAGVRVSLTYSLVADAAAAGGGLKLRRGATFTPEDLRLLEAHEGWVHLGTTLNGRAQPVLSLLSRCPPSATRTQEGLAVLTELLTGVRHGPRRRRLWQRLRAVAAAESGADFLDVYRLHLDWGCPPTDAYHRAARVFRGALPAGTGPFTKDVCYSTGLVSVRKCLADCLAEGRGDLVPLLFCGKTSAERLDELEELAVDGLLTRPRFTPAVFADPATLADRLRVWAYPRPPRVAGREVGGAVPLAWGRP